MVFPCAVPGFFCSEFRVSDTPCAPQQGRFPYSQDRIPIEGFIRFDSFGDLKIIKTGKDVLISFVAA